jgi:hypothetical protein
MNTTELQLHREWKYLGEALSASRYEDEYYRIMKRIGEIKTELETIKNGVTP